MRADVERIVRGADLSRWKAVQVEYGDAVLDVRVPADCVVLQMKELAPLADPEAAIRRSLANPVGSPPLEEIIRAKGKPAGELSVCITTSDITRPVPYAGKAGILPPLLATLLAAGIRKEKITLLVGTGTHRPSTPAEKVAMFGDEVASGYRIVDHECDNAAMLVSIGTTRSGTDVSVNRIYRDADVKIATGLVEAHFMAGVSAGRKAICPALVSRKTIEKFHGVEFLDSPLATNLVLEGNPCHEEALEVAKRCGTDFIVSTVLDRALRLVGVFSGDLEASHREAVAMVRQIVAVPVDREFGVVLTHGGYVGINHYQNAKAAVNALPILREGGILVLAARERDIDPVGPLTYRTLLHLLKLQGPDGYLAMLRNPSWIFTKDQWEPQMWGKVMRRIGEEGILYCSTRLSREAHRIVPGVAGWDFLADGPRGGDIAQAREMVQNAVIYAVRHPRWGGAAPSVAFLPEGPYCIPTLRAPAPA